ncbi:hypothetical protein JB92DRAFT_2813491 [Gautieria morchelliformis]|nr:hypothetical protein JB92DRAFT_2813491 [Gautieria morchelliformis]
MLAHVAQNVSLATRILLGGSSSFTTSALNYFPKLKSHSGTKKRWSSLPNGLFKRGKAGHKHLNATKAPGRINRLGATAYSHGFQSSKLRKLLPYG